MKKILLSGIALVLLQMSFLSVASAHCEIPCGIYDDRARFVLLGEDIQTVEKSMNEINALSKDPAANANQLTRWVLNKEKHADKIKELMATYFLSQRIKTPAAGDDAARADYLRELELVHQLTVAAMKAKQTTDLSHVEALRDGLTEFETLYWKIHGHSPAA